MYACTCVHLSYAGLTVFSRLFAYLREIFFRVQGGFGPAARRYDGLPIAGVAHVTGGEHAWYLGGLCEPVDTDVALLVGVNIVLEHLGVGLVAYREPTALCSKSISILGFSATRRCMASLARRKDFLTIMYTLEQRLAR